MDTSGDSCVFCEVVAGRAEASLAFQDDVVMVIMDMRPVNPGHALVISRAHAAGLADLDERVGAHMWCVARQVALGLRRSGLHCEGVNMWLADGEAALQDIFHTHIHVFPRFEGDDFVIDADCEPRERRLLNQEALVLRDAMRDFTRDPA